jgi:hypothetical protein
MSLHGRDASLGAAERRPLAALPLAAVAIALRRATACLVREAEACAAALRPVMDALLLPLLLLWARLPWPRALAEAAARAAAGASTWPYLPGAGALECPPLLGASPYASLLPLRRCGNKCHGGGGRAREARSRVPAQAAAYAGARPRRDARGGVAAADRRL